MKIRNCLAALAVACLPLAGTAADDVHLLPFEDIFSAEGASQLDGSVKFYLAGQKTPKVLESKGEFVSNRKSNAFGKDSQASCKRAALSALIALQDRAKQAGANAVVGIVSYYKKVTYSDATRYECHDGGLMSGVAFKGTVAVVASKP